MRYRTAIVCALVAAVVSAAPQPSIPPDPDCPAPLVYVPGAPSGAVHVWPVAWRSAAPHYDQALTLSLLDGYPASAFMVLRTAGDDTAGDYLGLAFMPLSAAPTSTATYALVDLPTGAKATDEVVVQTASSWTSSVTAIAHSWDTTHTHATLTVTASVPTTETDLAVVVMPASTTSMYSSWSAYSARGGWAAVSASSPTASVTVTAAPGTKVVVAVIAHPTGDITVRSFGRGYKLSE